MIDFDPSDVEAEILKCMEENKNSEYGFMRTRGYAEALYKGRIEIQRKVARMTKEEAYTIVKNNLDPDNEVSHNIVNAFEALGLIKFEEEENKEKQFTEIEAIKYCRATYLTDEGFARGIKKFGYKIVKA